MTKINRLTQIPTLDDSDLAVVWQDSSERTRAITIANLRKFIQSTDPNADAFVKAELVGDELILTAHDETETKIDINILPQHSVTELKDMPDNLIAGNYLKVNDEGTDFVLTPASETSAAVILEENGLFQGTANVLNFDDLDVEITNRIARISTKPVGGADGEIMKVENGKLVPSGVMSNKDGSLSLSSGSVDIGPHTISSSGEGIEATNESTGESYSFVFAGQGDDAGPVDRIFGDESVIKTTEDLSLQLTNHVSKLTATAETRIIKQPIIIKPVAPQTNVTMQITDLNGSDLWTYGPFDITVDENGDFEFVISTVLDFKVGEYLVTFLSPDGDVTLYGGISPISGEQIVYGELPFKPFHDETLHNIKTGGEIVREIEAGENVTTELVDGKLTVSAEAPDLSDYVRQFSRAQLSKLEVAYLGRFGDERYYPPISLEQVVGSANSLLKHTSAIQIESYDRITGDKLADILSADKDGFDMLVQPKFNGENLALAKDVPAIPGNGYVENYSAAELNTVQVAYQGKYGAERAFYPTKLYQDVNGWTQLEFTGNMQFKSKSKDSGVVGDKVFEVKVSSSVFHKKVEMKEPLNITKNTGTVFTINSDAVKFWSSGAIELPSYTAFKDKELITKEYAQQLIDDNTAKGYWIGGVLKDNINDEDNPSDEFTCNNPKHWLEYRKTTFQGSYALTAIQGDAPVSSEIVIHLHPESGFSSAPFKVVTSDGNEVTKTIRSNEKWRFYLRELTTPYFERVDDGASSSGSYDGQGLGVPEGEFFTTGTMNQSQPVALYYNALNDGSSRGNIELNNDDGYNEFQVIISGGIKATRDWRIGTGTPGRFSDKTIRMGETWMCRVFVDWNASSNTNFFWTKLDDGTSSYVEEEAFNAKSGYNKLVSGGGSTHAITYSENGSILKISNPTVKVQLLQGMSAENPHGYIKYINSHNADVSFEWYDRNGNQVTNNVPSVCPSDTVVEIFADYSKDEYVLNFGQSKVINTISEEDQLMEGLASGFIYAKQVSVG